MGKHHLEAVILTGIVAAGYLNAAIDLQRGFREVQHWRWAKADAHDVDSRLGQPAHQLSLERYRRNAPVIADRDARAAVAPHPRSEPATDGIGVGLTKRLAADPADIIFAQGGRIEVMGHGSPLSATI